MGYKNYRDQNITKFIAKHTVNKLESLKVSRSILAGPLSIKI